MNLRKLVIAIAVVCGLACGQGWAEVDSTNNAQLKRALERYPKADADGDGILTASEAKAFRDKQRGGDKKPNRGENRPKPTFANVKYGPHERNVLDIYQAKSKTPTPVIVYIHGGGFVGGDKKGVNPAIVKKCMQSGVTVAAINYRFQQHTSLPNILRDSARAIQFLRYNCSKYNIAKKRIASYGGSAGAGTSLWLGSHGDLADPKSKDPVLRESSRLSAAGSLNGQFTYDFEKWAELIGEYPGTIDNMAPKALSLYGLKDVNDVSGPKGKAIRADLDMHGLLTKDDAPVFLYTAGKNTDPTNHGHYVHHPRHSIAIRDKCKQVGVECEMLLRAEDPSLSGNAVNERMLKFFFKHLKVSG
ncbi:MAG: alpha/beta hydrolase [Phycisphaerae bacterium]|nr:alpha/beta hydrolase [Phycisphaerae bacterium]